MALKQMKDVSTKARGIDDCPNCRSQLLTIDGKLTQWKTCPKCDFKKLVRKGKVGPKVTSLR